MNIVAFMQNQWFTKPELHRAQMERKLAESFDTWIKWRRIFIKRALFFRCRSGQVLRSLLGDPLCQSIVWDEASPVICDNPRTSPPAEPEHMKLILDHYRPVAVITFGLVATQGLYALAKAHKLQEFTHIPSPHPACRAPRDHATLQAACQLLKETTSLL